MCIYFCMLRLRCSRSYAQHERSYSVHPERSGAKSKGQPMDSVYQEDVE